MKLAFLGPLYARPGPSTGAYLDTSRDVDDPDRAIDGRRRRVHDELAAQDADMTTTGAVAHAVGTDRLGLSAAELHAIGIDSSWAEPAPDAALIRAGVGTGAELVVGTRDVLTLADGVGALLRWPTPPPGAAHARGQHRKAPALGGIPRRHTRGSR